VFEDKTGWFFEQTAPEELEEVGQGLESPFQDVRVFRRSDHSEQKVQRVRKVGVKLLSRVSRKGDQQSEKFNLKLMVSINLHK